MPNTEMIDKRLRFLEIDRHAIEDLRAARQMLEPELDRMLDDFYTHILQETAVKAVFADEEAIKRARDSQKQHWLQTLLGGEFKSSYFDKAERIGRAHARVGLTPNWYIGGYSKMLSQFVEHVVTAAPANDREAGSIVQALCKAVLLDLDLVIQCYLEAKDEAMLEILGRATKFAADMDRLNVQLGAATTRMQETMQAVTGDLQRNGENDTRFTDLQQQVDELAALVKQVNERTTQLKTGDRLYVHTDDARTGTLAKLKTLLLGD